MKSYQQVERKSGGAAKRELVLAVRADVSASARLDSAEQLRETLESGRNANSERAYRADLEHFAAWCCANSLVAVPATAGTIADYINRLGLGTADEYGPRKIATVRRRLASIGKQHRLAGHADPTKDERVKQVLRALRRRLGSAPTQKTALLTEQLEACAAAAGATPGLAGLRDRALLLIGGGSAERRAELVAMAVADLRFLDGGVVVTIPVSKTNQEGEPEYVFVEIASDQTVCPVDALRAWIAAARIDHGFVFQGIRRGRLTGKPLSGNDVARLVKKYVRLAGVASTDDEVRTFAGHSLRSGYATSRARDGEPQREIQRQLRHASGSTTERYIRAGELLAKSDRALEARRARAARKSDGETK